MDFFRLGEYAGTPEPQGFASPRASAAGVPPAQEFQPPRTIAWGIPLRQSIMQLPGDRAAAKTSIVSPYFQPASERIWQLLAAIPEGKVASYGQLARLGGLGRGARQVGRILRELPTDSALPWHRVVTAQGRIALPPGSRAAQLQRRRLLAEGIEFSPGGAIPMEKFGWNPE